MASPLPPLRFYLLNTKSKSPNLSLFTLNRHPHRLLSTTPRHHFQPSQPQPQQPPTELPFRTGPSPPRLPKEDQDLFETLQRQSTGAFSTPREPHPPPQINQSPDSSDTADAAPATDHHHHAATEVQAQPRPQPAPAAAAADAVNPTIEARGRGAELHPAVRRGAAPEFEGDVNPRTGEVGGPKNEPLRWGGAGEWSYNGRTTDF